MQPGALFDDIEVSHLLAKVTHLTSACSSFSERQFPLIRSRKFAKSEMLTEQTFVRDYTRYQFSTSRAASSAVKVVSTSAIAYFTSSELALSSKASASRSWADPAFE